MKLTEEEKKIVEDNLPLVTYILKKYSWTYGDFDEYFQVGAYGLCKAVQRFDKSKGAFSTYASSYILGNVLQYNRNHMHGAVRPPRIGVSSQIRIPEYLYVDGILDENGNHLDILGAEDREEEIVSDLTIQEIRNNLTERERKIFDLSYAGKAQIEIANELKVSQAQISRIKKQIKTKVKECLA